MVNIEILNNIVQHILIGKMRIFGTDIGPVTARKTYKAGDVYSFPTPEHARRFLAGLGEHSIHTRLINTPEAIEIRQIKERLEVDS